MNDVIALLAQVRAAEAAGDSDALFAARERYLAADPAGPEAAEQRYRFGLSKLFRERDRQAAIALFRAASAERGAPIVPEARVSLAVLLLGTGQRQQAMFELRKMLPEGCVPTAHTAQALDMLSLAMRESGQPIKDIMATDAQRLAHLTTLASKATDPIERAQYQLRIAAAHADGGTKTDLAIARKKYEEVLKLGPTAGESTLNIAKTALRNLPR